MQIFDWQQIIEFYNQKKSIYIEECGISVGSFDGLHLGHRQLIKKLSDYCNKTGYKKGIVTFKRPLPSLKHSADYLGDISTLEQRLKLFESSGMDFVIVADFTPDFASLKGTEFFNVLLHSCKLRYLAEGEDFRCGYKGATDATAISYWAKENNVTAEFLPQVIYKDMRISSSYIRELIKKGWFTTVTELLCRPYELDLSSDSYNKDYDSQNLLQIIPEDNKYNVEIAFIRDNTYFEEKTQLEIKKGKLLFFSENIQVKTVKFI